MPSLPTSDKRLNIDLDGFVSDIAVAAAATEAVRGDDKGDHGIDDDEYSDHNDIYHVHYVNRDKKEQWC